MRQMKTVLVVAATAVAFTAPVVLAQQSQHQHDPGKQPPASSAPPGTSHGSMDAHMARHMEMCRQMMGQGGMMMGGDPKQQAEMMAMRGEMMKAMGDIMLKYAQRAQSAK